jgi:hypothetical protein
VIFMRTVILEETTVVGTEAGDYCNAVLYYAIPLVVGESYTVEFDGTKYDCECNPLIGYTGVGNFFLNGIGEDTGEPFSVLNIGSNNMTSVMLMDTNEHTIAIYQGSEETEQTEIRRGKAYLIHRMFPKVIAHTMTGKHHWLTSGGSAAPDASPDGVLESADGYVLLDSNELFLIAKEAE